MAPFPGLPRIFLLAAQLATLLATSLAVARPAMAAPLVLCMDEHPHPPFILAGGGGTVPALLREAGKAAGVDVRIYQAPLLRCWEEMRTGKAHGYTSSAAVRDMLMEFRFPMADGRVDTARAIGSARLVVFRRKGEPVHWDGQRFYNVRRPALAPAGVYSAAERMRNAGIEVDQQAKTLEQNFQKLLVMRGDVVLGFENDGRELLRQPRFAAAIDMLPAPLVEQHYYMMVTQRAYDSERVMIEAMWNAIGAIHAARRAAAK